MSPHPSRRDWLASAGAGLVAAAPVAAADPPAPEPFGYCLNTSTIQGEKLNLSEKVEIAVKAGYQGIEPWISELEQYRKQGGNLDDLGKRIRLNGLSVPSAIGFFEWIVDDPGRRKKGLDDARRAMELVREIGGQRLAAPPAGATGQADLNLLRAAERYRQLLELGERHGVVPEVEFWGGSKTLGRLGEAALVAIESGHPRACILADVFHLYKGGSDFTGLQLLGGSALHVLHFNDYPATPARTAITDAARVYPGDGVAPLTRLVRELRTLGFHGMLSLELFNRDYWQQDPLTVARTGLAKMRAVVRGSLR
jgi:sugar phosphate isomerase/epimerase